MDKLIVIFIKEGLPLMSLGKIEDYIEEWLNIRGNEYQDIILPHLIKLKLNKNEQEY